MCSTTFRLELRWPNEWRVEEKLEESIYIGALRFATFSPVRGSKSSTRQADRRDDVRRKAVGGSGRRILEAVRTHVPWSIDCKICYIR